jgi:hypothetical protein
MDDEAYAHEAVWRSSPALCRRCGQPIAALTTATSRNEATAEFQRLASAVADETLAAGFLRPRDLPLVGWHEEGDASAIGSA